MIHKRGMAAKTDRESMITALAGASEEANGQSPVPGPLNKVTTWQLLARLGCSLQEIVYQPHQPEVLESVGEWSISLLAWLCVGLRQWCIEKDEPSTHTLLATRPHGRGGTGPLLRLRMVVKKNIRGARRAWKEDAAKSMPGPASVLRETCGRHLHHVRASFEGCLLYTSPSPRD